MLSFCLKPIARGALLLAERLREAVEKHKFKDSKGKTYEVRISVGVSTYPDNAKQRSLLIKAADTALYKSKDEGRNRVTSASGLTVGETPHEEKHEEIKEEKVKEMVDRDFLLRKKAS